MARLVDCQTAYPPLRALTGDRRRRLTPLFDEASKRSSPESQRYPSRLPCAFRSRDGRDPRTPSPMSAGRAARAISLEALRLRDARLSAPPSGPGLPRPYFTT
jgi:hypothetical protein